MPRQAAESASGAGLWFKAQGSELLPCGADARSRAACNKSVVRLQVHTGSGNLFNKSLFSFKTRRFLPDLFKFLQQRSFRPPEEHVLGTSAAAIFLQKVRKADNFRRKKIDSWKKQEYIE
ncbi:hypothetical protein C6I21_07105 [Alkalicoccus urumqiensis]|uniref:Uncharacterized protein n=1 Tax=Alkalicoccus urumqiensis TaxID=1548213 RepID=A0A2P6MIE7_ALKUR|nr:hypothetical protein C6I21_07105 [Alkalicoccus urumqiensis]